MLKKDRSEIYLSFDVNGKHLLLGVYFTLLDSYFRTGRMDTIREISYEWRVMSLKWFRL